MQWFILLDLYQPETNEGHPSLDAYLTCSSHNLEGAQTPQYFI